MSVVSISTVTLRSSAERRTCPTSPSTRALTCPIAASMPAKSSVVNRLASPVAVDAAGVVVCISR